MKEKNQFIWEDQWCPHRGEYFKLNLEEWVGIQQAEIKSFHDEERMSALKNARDVFLGYVN